MIVRMGLLRKHPDLTMDAFRQHWRESHGPLAATLPGLRRYHQNHVVDREQRGVNFTRCRDDFDGFSELWFEDVDSLNAAFASDAGKTLMTHATEFIAEISTFLVEAEEVV